MKGIIATCLREMVTKNFGEEKWHSALELADIKRGQVFLISWDIEDAVVYGLIKVVCEVLHTTPQQAADAFGEYWVCTYSARLYRSYYDNAVSAKDFLLKMDEVHRITTQCIPNARPPRFEYTWLDQKTLIMKYKSARSLIDFLVGLVKAVGKYYGENLKVSKLNTDHIKICFHENYIQNILNKITIRTHQKTGG